MLSAVGLGLGFFSLLITAALGLVGMVGVLLDPEGWLLTRSFAGRFTSFCWGV
jgi:hypothetical protein